ncbi:hypothetical protein KAT92_06665 [Candidatus Babeliales bacterium]|nr:hypothetical protein [Candidatus Babeliales bacterium]
MIFSAQQIFSDDQAITATAISANVIDLGTPGTPYGAAAALNDDVGKGASVPILVQVTEDFATLTSLTITVEVSAAAGLTSPVALATETIAVADLVEGKQMFMQVLPNGADLRYLGVRYTVTGTNASAGKITAGITMGNQTNVTGA